MSLVLWLLASHYTMLINSLNMNRKGRKPYLSGWLTVARIGSINLFCQLSIDTIQVKPVDILSASGSRYAFSGFHHNESVLGPFEWSSARPVPFGTTRAIGVRDEVMVICGNVIASETLARLIE